MARKIAMVKRQVDMTAIDQAAGGFLLNKHAV